MEEGGDPEFGGLHCLHFHFPLIVKRLYFIQFSIKNMQAAQIRDKYKRILEEPEEEEDSEDEWEIAYSQMAQHRKKKILTESSLNLSASKENDKESHTLNLKQKLAQCLSNCKQHCSEIEKLKREQMVFLEEKK